jgi:hypothetical protein
MAPRTFPWTIILINVLPHIAFTARWLRAHPLTKDLPITLVFEELVTDWKVTQEKEIALDGQVADTAVAAAILDMELDAFAERTSTTLLMLNGKKRTDALYQHYFEGKPPHLFIKPTLGSELAAMKKWPTSLLASEHPALNALGAELPDLITRASQAETKKTDAVTERSDFREVGDRKKFIDRVNAARKEAYGILSTLPHKHVGLPSNFADQFFKRDRSKVGEEVTVEALEQEISELQAELTAKQGLRDKLKQEQSEEEQRRAREEAEQAAAKAELAAIEKEHAERAKRIAALKATIGAKA